MAVAQDEQPEAIRPQAQQSEAQQPKQSEPQSPDESTSEAPISVTSPLDPLPEEEPQASETPEPVSGEPPEFKSKLQKPVLVPVEDSARFRFGIHSGHGGLFERNNNYFYSGTDLRLGLQLNDSWGVYTTPRMGAYLGGGTDPGLGGLLGIGGGFDWTLEDRYFVGVGLGSAILNSPRMLDVSLRLGGYPSMGRNDTKSRRYGLSFAFEFHHYRGSLYRLYSPMLCLGYEAF